jgi:hypothetical protein
MKIEFTYNNQTFILVMDGAHNLHIYRGDNQITIPAARVLPFIKHAMHLYENTPNNYTI